MPEIALARLLLTVATEICAEKVKDPSTPSAFPCLTLLQILEKEKERVARCRLLPPLVPAPLLAKEKVARSPLPPLVPARPLAKEKVASSPLPPLVLAQPMVRGKARG